MNISESFKIAVKAIKANWMRSLLTMLGIIIGISSVIMIVGVRSVVEGQRQLPAGKAFRGGNRLVRLVHFRQIFPLHPHCQPAHDS